MVVANNVEMHRWKETKGRVVGKNGGERGYNREAAILWKLNLAMAEKRDPRRGQEKIREIK